MSSIRIPLIRRTALVCAAIALGLSCLASDLRAAAPKDGRYLYVVCPGIRNYLEFGGAGILVFDINDGHKFVRRINTAASRESMPDNIKGVCACAVTKRLYFTTRTKLYCLDL